MKEYVGMLQGNGLRIGIAVSRFNEMITKNLLSGALDALKRHGVDEHSISVAWVPGGFELPLILKTMAQTGNFDALIGLGAVIRGATPHFEYVANLTASGIANASMETGIPILFGVLTTETIEQAIERAGTKCGNKGFDMAVGAIEMANLLREFKQLPGKRTQQHPISATFDQKACIK